MNLFGLTDTGKVRADNQDSYAIRVLDDDLAVAVVCDGMGGAQAGNVASAVAVETFAAAVEEACRQQLPETEREREHLMREACYKANQVVHDLSLSTPEYHGMGTTLVGLLIQGDAACVVNVGDSRAYLFREGTSRQLTLDHSLVQLLVSRGELTPEQARVHPKKNFITRALGVDAEVRADIFHLSVCPGDRLMLCSDGLSNVLSDQQLLEDCAAGELEDCCRRMMVQTLDDGAPDNVTMVLAQL